MNQKLNNQSPPRLPPPLITELKAPFEDHHAKALCLQRPLHNAADADDADYIDAYQDCIDAYQEDHFLKYSGLLSVFGLRSRCI